MNRILLLGVVAALATACSPKAAPPAEPAPTPVAVETPAAAPVDSTDPVAVVRALYTPYLTRDAQIPDMLQTAPWTDSLRAEIQRVFAASQDEPILDYDPIISAQDWEIASVDVALEAPPADGKAVVIAKFRNMDRDETLRYDMVDVNGAWEIDDIRNTDFGLRSDIKKGLAEAGQ